MELRLILILAGVGIIPLIPILVDKISSKATIIKAAMDMLAVATPMRTLNTARQHKCRLLTTPIIRVYNSIITRRQPYLRIICMLTVLPVAIPQQRRTTVRLIL